MTLPIGPSARFLPSNGMNAELDQLLAVHAIGAVRDRQTHDRIDRPGMQTPVEHRRCHGRSNTRLGTRRRRDEVGERLADAVEHQADTHSGAEHHRDPADRVELGLLAVLTERDLPEPADRQPYCEQHETGRSDDEEPAEVHDEPGENRVGNTLQVVGPHQAPHQNRRSDRGGHREDNAVDGHRAMVLRTGFVTGRGIDQGRIVVDRHTYKVL
jgi:hypothetical protein